MDAQEENREGGAEVVALNVEEEDEEEEDDEDEDEEEEDDDEEEEDEEEADDDRTMTMLGRGSLEELRTAIEERPELLRLTPSTRDGRSTRSCIWSRRDPNPSANGA
jgi:hypothetical protein